MINNPEIYQKAIWNETLFITGSVVQASDIDLCLESRGQFLCFEFKTYEYQADRKPIGQLIMLARLHQLGIATICYVYGETNQPTMVEIMNNKGNYRYENIDNSFLQKIIHNWYQYTLTLPKPKFINPKEIVFKKMN